MFPKKEEVVMEWTKSETIGFIHLLEVFPCLWNNKNKDYKNRKIRQETLVYLSQEINTDVNSIEKKILSLRTQYNRELHKVKKNAEAGIDNKSSWYAFDLLHFLRDREDQRPSIGTDSFTITFEKEEECADISTDSIEEIFITQPQRSIDRRNQTLSFSRDMSNVIARKQKKDDLSFFGQVVASELRDLKTRRQVLELKKKIMDLVYETKLNLEKT